jgi:hypothetical protein
MRTSDSVIKVHREALSLRQNTLEALAWICGQLNAAQIPFHLGGGFAAQVYIAAGDLSQVQLPLRIANDIDIDLRQADLPRLREKIAATVTTPPQAYADSTWALLSCMTAVFKDQELDFTAADTGKIFNMHTEQWDRMKFNVGAVQLHSINGLNVPLQLWSDLIEQKAKIAHSREKHLRDIQNMRLAVSGGALGGV